MKLISTYVSPGLPVVLVCALVLSSVTACATTQLTEGDPSDRTETVDIGYGTVDKDSYAGSASNVQTQDPNASRPRTLAEMLSRVPGVMVHSTSDQSLTVRIRGNSSLQSGNSPLYVLDGMVIQGLSAIHPDQIESITVLKDAEATAVYGSRGSNGVILFRTKR